MIDTDFYKSTRDQKINSLRLHLPKGLKELNVLCKKSIGYFQNSNYADNDLRKTIFAKFYLLFVNFAIHCDLIIEEKHLSRIIKKWRLHLVSADYLENFFKFELRSLYSDSIELVDHLIASILESCDEKKGYMKFNKMLDLLKKRKVLGSEDIQFLEEWMDGQRNPRHRNFEDYYKGGKPVTYSIPLDFDNFEQLVKKIQAITANPLVKKIFLVEDKNPR